MKCYFDAGAGVRDYISPRWRSLSAYEEETRSVAYELRYAESTAVALAAREMALFVGYGEILVPIPNSKGDTTANRILAAAIADETGAVVLDILRRKRPVPSARLTREREKLSPTVEEHAMVREGAAPRGQVVFVDNVMTTGTTFRAAQIAIGKGTGLAFAQVPERYVEGEGWCDG